MEKRIKDLALYAAYVDARNEQPSDATKATWWAGHLSYKLGIVDSSGRIDIDGEVARAFKKEYLRVPLTFSSKRINSTPGGKP
jgi:hypothetical protein